MPFDFSQIKTDHRPSPPPASGVLRNDYASVAYDTEHISVKLSSYSHSAVDAALQLLSTLQQDNRINSTDHGVAQRLLRDCAYYGEPDERWTVIGTRINVGRSAAQSNTLSQLNRGDRNG